MEEPIRSRPYKADMCCELCVFARGEHSEGCKAIQRKKNAILQLEVLSKVANKLSRYPSKHRFFTA